MRRRCKKCHELGHFAKTCSRKSKGKIRRYKSTGSVTKSRRGREFVGAGRGWLVLYHGGRTGETLHDKSWSIRIVKKGSGWTVITRHGRRSGQKNETVRASMSKDAASRLADSLLNSKLRKGYVIVGKNRK